MKGCMILKAVFISLMLMLAQGALAQETEAVADVALESEQVHINQADMETIAQILDGVGLSRAQAIVEWRQQYGAFETLEDLLLVNGIGEQTVQRNQHKILFD